MVQRTRQFFQNHHIPVKVFKKLHFLSVQSMHTMVDLGEKEEVGPLFDYSKFLRILQYLTDR